MTPEQKAVGPEKRKRLVISFEQPRGAKVTSRKRGSRWPKLLAALGIVMVTLAVLAVGGAFLWWQHYKTTPAYSLALLVDAVQRNDVVVVNQIVDVDKIVDNLAGEVTQKTVGRYGATLSPALRGRVEALVPSLLPSVKQKVHDSLVKRLQEISEKSEPKPFVILAIGLPYLVDITREGDSARAIAPLQDREIELGLQRNGDLWRVTAMKDDTVVQHIVDDIIREFPAIGSRR
jgi:hypothetical protein